MHHEVKPFLKWAGGKTQILNQIEENFPKELKEGKIKKYMEPFVGGGAVLFYILQKHDFDEVVINDINEDLILTYNVIKNDVNKLIDELESLRENFLLLDDDQRKEFYYNVRDEFNKKNNCNEINEIKRVAQFIFLNKTCFNGLYRVNKKGEFNVPYGRYKNPKIFDEKNLKNASKLLKNVKILCNSFEVIDDYVDDETFVYFDPPYKPLNKTSSFTSYTKYNFDDNDQIRLAKFYKKLDKKGCKLMLSNSDNLEFFEKLYGGFNIKKVIARRIINSKGNKRGAIFELLILNY